MSSETYTLREAQKHETSAIMAFLEAHHSLEDPITRGFFSTNKHRITADEIALMQEDFRDFIDHSVCILALYGQKIVGTVIIVPYTYLPPSGKRLPGRSQLLQELESLIHKIYEDVGLAERFPLAKSDAKLRSLAVHNEHRGRGLAKSLLNESIGWARRHGIDIVHSFFTTAGARKAAEATGFEEILAYDLKAVRDAEGQAVFGDLGEECFTWVMTKEVM